MESECSVYYVECADTVMIRDGQGWTNSKYLDTQWSSYGTVTILIVKDLDEYPEPKKSTPVKTAKSFFDYTDNHSSMLGYGFGGL